MYPMKALYHLPLNILMSPDLKTFTRSNYMARFGILIYIYILMSLLKSKNSKNKIKLYVH